LHEGILASVAEFFVFDYPILASFHSGGRLLSYFSVVTWASEHEAEHADHVSFLLGADGAVLIPETEIEAAAHARLDVPIVHSMSFALAGRVTSHDTYGEIYAGPAFHYSRLTFAPSIGLETAEFPLRVAGSLGWTQEHFESLLVVEYGGSGYWYSVLMNGWMRSFGIGAFAQCNDGLGPWVGLRLHPLEFWTAALVYNAEDTTKHGMVLGLHWSH